MTSPTFPVLLHHQPDGSVNIETFDSEELAKAALDAAFEAELGESPAAFLDGCLDDFRSDYEGCEDCPYGDGDGMAELGMGFFYETAASHGFELACWTGPKTLALYNGGTITVR